ncbi:MAG: ABC transporter ATP-binding protein [Desulfobacterales bacterium]|nr:ABC transporter ATP-binding protein [Desulfobacterales bacterium]
MPDSDPLPSPPVRPGAWRILLRSLNYLRPYWRLTGGAYLCLVITTGLALVIPQLIRQTVDEGIRGGDIRALRVSVLAILGVTLGKGLLTFIMGRWAEMSSQGVVYDLRNALYHRLSSLQFSYHDRSQAGQLLSRAIQDVERIRFLTGRALLRLTEALVLFVGAGIFLLIMNPFLMVLSISTIPTIIYRAGRFSRRYRPLSLAIQQQLAVLTVRLEQNLRGSRVVKAFAQEPAEIDRFDRENDRWFDFSARAEKLRAFNSPLLDLVANLGTVIIIWYGGMVVIRGHLTLGELVAFLTYMGLLIRPVRRLGFILPALANATAAGERIFEILDMEPDVKNLPGARPLPPVRGHVCFKNVFFNYHHRNEVLKDVALEALPGQVIALLGLTGSGKSSIINLIPRFYDPTAGHITIDGQDIRTVQLRSLREQIGIVLQETTLFATTIRENICFGKPDAAQEEIVEAAKAAQAHDFILQMPRGYDTPVGERGVTLSGGQKQRIAIARALLKAPAILILDDATASVDSDTEQLIQTALEHLMHGRTSFVIAQRLSTVYKADLILVLDQGRIVEKGTHGELLHRSSIYTEIYHRQLQPRPRTLPLQPYGEVTI